jgi:hypothetical protein
VDGFEAGEEGMGQGAGGELPHRLELIIEDAVAIVLVANLHADDLVERRRSRVGVYMRARAVAGSHGAEIPLQIGQPVVDGQVVAAPPLVRSRRANVILIGVVERPRVSRVDRDALQGGAVIVDDAVGIRRLVQLAGVEAEIERVIAHVPDDVRPELVIGTLEVAKPVRVGGRPVDAIVQARNGRGAGDVASAVDGPERACLYAGAVVKIRRWRVIDDVDRAARRTAAEQRRTRPSRISACFTPLSEWERPTSWSPSREPSL